jgi:hypothetical protein
MGRPYAPVHPRCLYCGGPLPRAVTRSKKWAGTGLGYYTREGRVLKFLAQAEALTRIVHP